MPHVPHALDFYLCAFSCLSVCSSSCLTAVTPVLLVLTIQAVVDPSKWILLPAFPFYSTDLADGVSGVYD